MRAASAAESQALCKVKGSRAPGGIFLSPLPASNLKVKEKKEQSSLRISALSTQTPNEAFVGWHRHGTKGRMRFLACFCCSLGRRLCQDGFPGACLSSPQAGSALARDYLERLILAQDRTGNCPGQSRSNEQGLERIVPGSPETTSWAFGFLSGQV